ncbi:MAG: 50S ribosomal protein L31 [Bacillota bacterium]
MQKQIHPELKETTITCACGEVYHTKSTREDVRIEVCGKCHPVYTGRKRKSAKGGRVERFREKYGLSEEETEEVEESTETAETEEEAAEDTETEK